MNNLPKISKDDFLEAIKAGITEAILTMTESGDGYSGIIRTEEFMNKIQEGVHSAIWQIATNATSAPCSDFYDSIQKGVEKAMEFKNLSFDK